MQSDRLAEQSPVGKIGIQAYKIQECLVADHAEIPIRGLRIEYREVGVITSRGIVVPADRRM